MTRTLLLMRHAEAESGYGTSDFDRALTDRGRHQAAVVGRLLSERGYVPDHVICSASLRTRQSLTEVLGTMELTPEVDYTEAAYSAGVDTLLELVNIVDAGAKTVLLMAHNPGIAQLAADFVGHRALMAYQPATVAAVGLEVEWLHAAPGTGEGHLLN